MEWLKFDKIADDGKSALYNLMIDGKIVLTACTYEEMIDYLQSESKEDDE